MWLRPQPWNSLYRSGDLVPMPLPGLRPCTPLETSVPSTTAAKGSQGARLPPWKPVFPPPVFAEQWRRAQLSQFYLGHSPLHHSHCYNVVFIRICQFFALGKNRIFVCMPETFCDPKICQKCISGRGSSVPDLAGGARDAPQTPIVGWWGTPPLQTPPNSQRLDFDTFGALILVARPSLVPPGLHKAGYVPGPQAFWAIAPNEHPLHRHCLWPDTSYRCTSWATCSTVSAQCDSDLINPLKPSGAKWLHLRASRAILV